MIYQFCVFALVGTYASMTSALPPCACARNLKPVCGSDGQTYNNECLLNCERTKNPDLVLNKVGSCDAKSSGCACTLEYSPICGSDGVTYPNMCSFECDAGEAKQAYSGECRAKREAPIAVSLQECRCSKEADAVCGTDGNTYLNPCLLECAKKVKPDLDLAVRGPCAAGEREFDAGKPNCACTRNLQPVCASDGNTYNNECLMRCAGADLTVTKDEPCYDE